MNTLNIAYDWNNPDTDSSMLSNFHKRKFSYCGRQFQSVEQAYQSLKSGYFDDMTYSKYETMYKYDLPIRKIRGKPSKSLPYSIELIMDLVKESLIQNRDVWSILGNYDNFTHEIYVDGNKCSTSAVDQAFLNMIHYMSRLWKDGDSDV